jgi:hypothetical protein
METSKHPHFIPTDETTSHSTGETPSHSTRLSKNDNQVAGYKSPKNGNQVAGYAALRKKFLAYISDICGAAKFFPRLAFGRTLNF